MEESCTQLTVHDVWHVVRQIFPKCSQADKKFMTKKKV